MNKEKRGKGRPPKFDKETLIDILYKYSAEHPGEKIKISILAKDSNIPRHVWEYQMKDEIKLFNLHLIEIDDSKLDRLPRINYANLVKKYENNPNKLQEVLSEIDFISQTSKDACIHYDKLKKKYNKLLNSLRECQDKLKEKDDMISFLQIQNKEMVVNSSSELKRKQFGLKKDLCKLTLKNDSITKQDIEMLTRKINQQE